MKWHTPHVRSSLTEEDFISNPSTEGPRLSAFLEVVWKREKRPYYNLWPCISEAIANTSLDFSLGGLQLFPLESSFKSGQRIFSAMAIRFAQGNEHTIFFPDNTHLRITSLLFLLCSDSQYDNNLSLGVLVNVEGFEEQLARVFKFTRDEPIQDAMSRHFSDIDVSEQHKPDMAKFLLTPVRIVMGVLLMAANPHPDILSPVVLNADKSKYDLNGDQKYVDKARRRGVIGWDIGANIEFSPHFRRPHFGLRWTGKGRQIPQIVPIKGCIVKRNKMTEVPTGYLDDGEDKHVPVEST